MPPADAAAAGRSPLGPALDWQSPWLQPLASGGVAAEARVRAGQSVADALNQLHGAEAPWLAAGRLRFVPQAELPAGEAYEACIHRCAQVPTRDNLHDFFNGLVWRQQPQLKRRLNELQAQAIAVSGVGAHRGPLRDALTLMDENGALLQAPEPLLRALRGRDWPALFVTHRGLWPQARLSLVGHALLEKLALAPRKGLTAHVLLASADECVAWPAERWAAKPFCPLPVMGVPAWWPGQQLPGFYGDREVFRPPPGVAGRGTMPL